MKSIFVKCMRCGKVCAHGTWQYLTHIDGTTMISHGYCPECGQREHEQLSAMEQADVETEVSADE